MPHFFNRSYDEVADFKGVQPTWDESINLRDKFRAAMRNQREESLVRKIISLVEASSQHILVHIGYGGNGLHFSSKPIQNSNGLYFWMFLQLVEAKVNATDIGRADYERKLKLL